MAYLVVLRFNSATNARNFVNAYPDLNSQVVQSSLSGTYVIAEPELLSQMPTGDFISNYSPLYTPIATYNQQGQLIQYQPGFDLTQLTLTTSNGNPLIFNGVPATDTSEQDPPPVPYDPYNPNNPQYPVPPPQPFNPYDPYNPLYPIPSPQPFNPYDPFNPQYPVTPIDPRLVSLIYPTLDPTLQSALDRMPDSPEIIQYDQWIESPFP